MSAVSDTPTTEMPLPFVFTDAAADKVKQLIDEEGNPDLKLRVFVQGGGCSGFQYGFTFDEEVNEDDTVMDKAGVQALANIPSREELLSKLLYVMQAPVSGFARALAALAEKKEGEAA